MSQLNEYIDSITELYKKLDDLLITKPDIQYNNKAVQHVLAELEKAKTKMSIISANSQDIRVLENKAYPLIQDKKFTLSTLTAQYEGIYDLEQIASKLYKQYANVQPGTSTQTETPAEKLINDSVFKLTPMQKLLRNMMSVDTPYRGLLVVHGTGVGKTCTAVSIAENLKSFVQHNKQKIYVLRDREFRQQIFDINMVSKGQPGFQCTGETYLNELRATNPRANELIIDCEQGQKQSCVRVEKLVNKEVDKYYSFSSPEIWAKQINRVLETKTKALTDSVAKQKKQIALIRTMFNNSILIIDEAHNLRNIAGGGKADKGETPVKFVISVLMKVLLYSQNMRLILLTATPMYDQPTDIIPLLNFLLTNDKRPSIQEKDIFDTDNNIKDKAKLLDITRGYISYVRGNDPMDFPIRLDASVNLDADELIDLTAYPTKDIYGKPLDPANKIKHMCLVSCPMSPDHQAVLLSQININPAQHNTTTSSNNIIKTNTDEIDDLGDDVIITDDTDKQFTVAYNTELQMSNYIYRTLDDSTGVTDQCYGKRGLSSIARRTSGKGINYTFKDEEYAHRFIGDGLRKHGPKLAACIDNILNSTGPVFIYTRFTPGGVIPLAFALEMLGFTRYNKEPELLTSKYKSPDQTRGEYVIFTGDPLLSRGAAQYFKLGKKMVENMNVRVVIASEKGSEGLNLYGFREAHIIDPWHNINLIEQTIGRVIRYKSHNHIENPALRNVTIYMYATVLTGKFKDRESLDLHTYSIAENKAFKSGQVEYVLKTNAVDCNMMMALNYRPRALYEKPVMLITSTGKIIPYHLYDIPYSKDALYMKDSGYTCAIKDLPSANLPALNRKLDIKQYEIEIREIIGSITAILRETFNILEADLLTVIEASFPNIKAKDHSIIQELYKYVLEYFEVSDIILLDKYGRSSRVVVVPVSKVKKQSMTTSVLRLIPLGYFDTAQPVTTQELSYLRAKDYGRQQTKEKRRIADISLLPLITALRKDKQKLVNKEELNYNDIISKFADNINRILGGVNKALAIITDADLQQYYLFETNMKITAGHGLTELYKTIFDRLLYVEKLFIIQNLVYKIKTKNKHTQLNDIELKILSVIGFIFVHQYEIFKPHGTSISTDELYKTNYMAEPDQLYGFIIAEFNKLTLYKWQDDVKATGDDIGIKGYFVEDKQKLTTLVNKRRSLLESVSVNKLFGFLTYTKNTTLPPIFKITDYLSRGIKKSVKGVACSSKQVNDIYSYIKVLDPANKLLDYKESKNKKLACSDLELVFRQKNNTNTVAPWDSGYTYYFLSPEEYYIWLMI